VDPENACRPRRICMSVPVSSERFLPKVSSPAAIVWLS
jgi:hypothetical protein